MRLRTLAVVTAATSAFLVAPGAANAAFTSAIAGTTVTLTGDAAADTLVITESAGVLQHNQVGGGFNSATDWDTTAALDQTVPSDGTFIVAVNSGDGIDAITFATVSIKAANVDGGADADTVTGSPANDQIRGGAAVDDLHGGDGDDRILGDTSGDTIAGDAGNDLMIWNNGDGSDTNDGGAGADTQEVNGSTVDGDTFTIQPDADPGQVRFDRTNLVPFFVDFAAERLTVNGIGGNDSITGAAGIAGRTLPSLDGGPGVDTIIGSDAPDLIAGGDGNDSLSGAGQDDRILGNRGADAMAGGDGDDTMVWNNGDGNDTDDGDAGYDVVEVNGNPLGDDVFTVTPDGARARFDRTNVGLFNISMAAEVLDLNALGGNDTLTVSDNAPILIDADGGSGNDGLTGANGNDSLLGGSGNDNLTGGLGFDVLDGAEGDDVLLTREGIPDLLRGGTGNDSATTDSSLVDKWDGVESVDATPLALTPAARKASIKAGALKNGRLRVRVACPTGGARCKGTLELVTAKRVKAGRARVIVSLGSAKYNLAAGKSRVLSVRLVRGFASLAAKGAKRLSAKAIARNGNGATATKRLSIKLPKPK